MGGRWVHLRMCMQCGHIGCCDNSPNRHATAHWHEHRASDHPLVRTRRGLVVVLSRRLVLRDRRRATCTQPSLTDRALTDRARPAVSLGDGGPDDITDVLHFTAIRVTLRSLFTEDSHVATPVPSFPSDSWACSQAVLVGGGLVAACVVGAGSARRRSLRARRASGADAGLPDQASSPRSVPVARRSWFTAPRSPPPARRLAPPG